MSVGPAALGNVLVQRLDAVLGTAMAGAANAANGARADAVAGTAPLERPGAGDTAPRDPRAPVQGTGTPGERPSAPVDPKLAAALALAARGLTTSTDTTASAPTTLGFTARSILSLFNQYPERPPAVQGRAPIWSGAVASQGPAAQGGQPPTTAQAMPGAAAAASAPPPSQQGAAQAAPAPASSAPAASAPAPATPTAQPAPAHAGAAPAMSANPSMLALAAPTSRALAISLRQTLQTSGLFYESHLSDLAFGKRTLEQIRAEPQAQLKHAEAARPGQPSHPLSRNTVADTAGQAGASPDTTAPQPSAGPPVPGVHPESNALVRQQLELLANQSLYWQGEAWPGTPMEWEVRREPREADDNEAQASWATRLKMDLPNLGLIDARLSLSGDQIVLQLIAPHSAAELNAASDALRSGLLNAGLTLSNLSVHVVEPRPVLPPEDQ